jgi:SAM-dependent methyltransferase
MKLDQPLLRGYTSPNMFHRKQAWNEIFEKRGRVFADPHEEMPRVVRTLKKSGGKTVLDLGCGTGRHIIYLAELGFAVYGLDSSPEGIEASRQWLFNKKLVADLRVHDMTDRLPFDDGFFDAVVSVQVIHHAELATIRHVVREVTRVLKPGGFVFVTVPKIKNQARTFEQIEENTFVPLDGPEKGLPHHYFTAPELREIFSAFDIRDIRVDGVKHYCLSAFKRALRT